MPALQPEPARPEPTERHVYKNRPQEDAEPDRTEENAVGSAVFADAKGVGDGGPPPPPPNDATHFHFVVWLKAAIHAAGERAARIRYRVIVLLVSLVAIAAAAVVAGMLAKSDTFWAASALAFSAAFCGLVAYAAKELGVFAETADLLSRSGKEGTHTAEPRSPLNKAPGEQELRTRIRGEFAFEIARNVRDLSADPVLSGTDTELHGLVRAEERIVRIGAEARHAPSARRLGQLHLADGPMARDVVLAEEALVTST